MIFRRVKSLQCNKTIQQIALYSADMNSPDSITAVTYANWAKGKLCIKNAMYKVFKNLTLTHKQKTKTKQNYTETTNQQSYYADTMWFINSHTNYH